VKRLSAAAHLFVATSNETRLLAYAILLRRIGYSWRRKLSIVVALAVSWLALRLRREAAVG
jgi:hypothetical protein